MTANRKPRIFIGSSREATPYAEAVAAQLEYYAEVNPWWAGVFGANDYTMEALDRELDANDFGVFIFAAEDIAKIRGKNYLVTRDNTLFEMGLFWGRLGRRRVFCVIPSSIPQGGGNTPTEFHLPSDFDGLTLLRYSDNVRKSAAVVTPCGAIRDAVLELGLFKQRHEIIDENKGLIQQKDSVLNFFWEYLRNVSIPDSEQRYSAFSEAIRNSILPPDGFRVTGAALWRKIDDEHIAQVGGNVGRGKRYHLTANDGRPEEEHITVVRVHGTDDWRFFKQRGVADVHVLCYSLGRNSQHVLSVHFSGNRTLTDEQLGEIVVLNDDLLLTIRSLVGGDSR
ncbi:MAG TPA: TIR domain-containing protein [Paenibacillus sp.]|nr:TIR domain-containing protein [Paenibacillus sp.]